MLRQVLNHFLLLLVALPAVAQEPAVPPETVPPPADAVDTAPPEPQLSTERKKSSSRSSRYGRDITAIGENITVKEGEVVKEVVVIGGSVTIDGKVTGDLVVIGGNVVLGPSAELRRDITVVGGGLETDPKATIEGERVVLDWNAQMPTITLFEGVPDWISEGLLKGRPFAPSVSWSWFVGGVFLILYVVLAVLFPGPLRASIGVLDEKPGSSFLTGLLAFVLFLPLLILLVVTVVGIILIPFLGCAGIAALLFGKAAVYGYTGRRLSGAIEFLRQPVVAVIIGAIVFYILYMIPFLGFLVWCIVAPLGIGAVLLAFFGKLRSEKPKPVAPAPHVPAGASVPEAVASAPQIATGPGSASTALPLAQPRAGFWLRLVATLIDAALIGTICMLLRTNPGWFIVLWTAYHIVMWTWRGATVGGMVFSLRIVQTNGQPVTLGVAIVRALASFLSAIVLLLGFFWAGWSARKQSWHDIIAGTYVVKVPREKPLEVSPAV